MVFSRASRNHDADEADCSVMVACGWRMIPESSGHPSLTGLWKGCLSSVRNQTSELLAESRISSRANCALPNLRELE